MTLDNDILFSPRKNPGEVRPSFLLRRMLSFAFKKNDAFSSFPHYHFTTLLCRFVPRNFRNFFKKEFTYFCKYDKIKNVKRTERKRLPRKGVLQMTDYEMLMVTLTFISIIVTLVIAYIKK